MYSLLHRAVLMVVQSSVNSAHFQPVVQLIRMMTLDISCPQHIDQAQHHTNDDLNDSHLYDHQVRSTSIWAIVKQQIGYTDAGNYIAINNNDYREFP